MKAIVQDVYGEADVLRLEEIDRPQPGDDAVLLRARAAGVDRGVWHIMAGLPYPIRLAGYGFRVPNQRVRGREVAGRVEAVGKNVTTLNPGDDAFGIAEGSFAEYTVGRAEKLAPKPTNLTFQQAAATTISALMTVADISGGMPAPIIKSTPFVIRTAGVDAPLASKCPDRWLVLRVPGDPQDGHDRIVISPPARETGMGDGRGRSRDGAASARSTAG